MPTAVRKNARVGKGAEVHCLAPTKGSLANGEGSDAYMTQARHLKTERNLSSPTIARKTWPNWTRSLRKKSVRTPPLKRIFCRSTTRGCWRTFCNYRSALCILQSQAWRTPGSAAGNTGLLFTVVARSRTTPNPFSAASTPPCGKTLLLAYVWLCSELWQSVSFSEL
jgi:hypothetical protein